MDFTVELDEGTYRSVELAARIAGVSMGQVVARLIVETGATGPGGTADPGRTETVGVYSDYEGHRTHARFDPRTHRIDLTSGPLSGQSFKTPSGAAIAIVRHYKPEVNANRNGWSFWLLEDESGRPIQSIRYEA